MQDGLAALMRGWWPDRNPPRRTADRVQANVMAALIVMFLAGTPLAALAAAGWAAAGGSRGAAPRLRSGCLPPAWATGGSLPWEGSASPRPARRMSRFVTARSAATPIYMATEPFRQVLVRLLGDASRRVTVSMCAETLWWRCHRRLIADAATILSGAAVWHLGHDWRLSAHQLTPGVRRGPGGKLVYDAGQPVTAAPASWDPAAACRVTSGTLRVPQALPGPRQRGSLCDDPR